jgi:Calcineurin-like phosphoesterase
VTFITGDCHGTSIDSEIMKLSKGNWPASKSLTKKDYVIVAGDWGVVWNGLLDSIKTENYLINFHNKAPFTTLVVRGNHDNVLRLEEFPEVEMFGDIVKQISDTIFYLLDGHVYNIDGKTIFVMGGADSFDKAKRVEGVSWWREEVPSYMTIKTGIERLAKVNNKVDYVVTHAIFTEAYEQLFGTKANERHMRDPMIQNLQVIKDTIDYKMWYCGHYHKDQYLPGLCVRVLYYKIVELGG